MREAAKIVLVVLCSTVGVWACVAASLAGQVACVDGAQPYLDEKDLPRELRAKFARFQTGINRANAKHRVGAIRILVQQCARSAQISANTTRVHKILVGHTIFLRVATLSSLESDELELRGVEQVCLIENGWTTRTTKSNEQEDAEDILATQLRTKLCTAKILRNKAYSRWVSRLTGQTLEESEESEEAKVSNNNGAPH